MEVRNLQALSEKGTGVKCYVRENETEIDLNSEFLRPCRVALMGSASEFRALAEHLNECARDMEIGHEIHGRHFHLGAKDPSIDEVDVVLVGEM
jgi:hypothetical protein